MKFSYNWLQSFFNQRLPQPGELAKKLMMHSFEVESLERKDKDFILDIKVLPNRAPDCFSHYGIAKEISTILDLKIKNFAKIKQKQLLNKKYNLKITVKQKENCKRYLGQSFYNVKVEESPKWLKERLSVLGLQPINNVVDLTNYVMLEIGQPCHAFDLDKISLNNKNEKEIIVRNAKENEKILCLDNKEYQLNKDIVVISDSKRAIAIAGIKGGLDTGIEKNTKNILVEFANFDPVKIRKGSQKLKLKTDASIRFEHSLSSYLIDLARERLMELFKKYVKCEIGNYIDYYPQKDPIPKIKIEFDYIYKLLGIEIKRDTIIKILKKLGFSIIQQSQDFLLLEPPNLRLDLNIKEDIVEEIGRIYGLEKIEEKFPIVCLTKPKENEDFKFIRKIKQFLKEQKFFEVYNYSFISEEDKKLFSLKNLIEVRNPPSISFKYLRPNLILNLLKNVKDNQKILEFFPDFENEIRIFEIGNIFFKKGKILKEEAFLSGLIFIKNNLKNEIFYELKGILNSLFNNIFIFNPVYSDINIKEILTPLEFWNIQKTAKILIKNKEIAILGEIHPLILQKFGIEGRVVAFESQISKLRTLSQEELEYEPIPNYPPILRDLSIVVPIGTKVVDILNIIERVGKGIIFDIDLFDIFSGEIVAKNKESLSFHIIYLDKNKPLKPEIVDKVHNEIIEALEKNPNFKVRK
ncbi:MAG: phenylalanine--tRNA ligase subunit beta [Minisyncoccia bacterium]